MSEGVGGVGDVVKTRSDVVGAQSKRWRRAPAFNARRSLAYFAGPNNAGRFQSDPRGGFAAPEKSLRESVVYMGFFELSYNPSGHSKRGAGAPVALRRRKARRQELRELRMARAKTTRRGSPADAAAGGAGRRKP
jgi:hypothetical protein